MSISLSASEALLELHRRVGPMRHDLGPVERDAAAARAGAELGAGASRNRIAPRLIADVAASLGLRVEEFGRLEVADSRELLVSLMTIESVAANETSARRQDLASAADFLAAELGDRVGDRLFSAGIGAKSAIPHDVEAILKTPQVVDSLDRIANRDPQIPPAEGRAFEPGIGRGPVTIALYTSPPQTRLVEAGDAGRFVLRKAAEWYAEDPQLALAFGPVMAAGVFLPPDHPIALGRRLQTHDDYGAWKFLKAGAHIAADAAPGGRAATELAQLMDAHVRVGQETLAGFESPEVDSLPGVGTPDLARHVRHVAPTLISQLVPGGPLAAEARRL